MKYYCGDRQNKATLWLPMGEENLPVGGRIISRVVAAHKREESSLVRAQSWELRNLPEPLTVHTTVAY